MHTWRITVCSYTLRAKSEEQFPLSFLPPHLEASQTTTETLQVSGVPSRKPCGTATTDVGYCLSKSCALAAPPHTHTLSHAFEHRQEHWLTSKVRGAEPRYGPQTLWTYRGFKTATGWCHLSHCTQKHRLKEAAEKESSESFSRKKSPSLQ